VRQRGTNERLRPSPSQLARGGTSAGTPTRPQPKRLLLPEGWEIARNANGDTYYVDHVNKITSWEHPVSPLSEAAQEFFEGTAL